MPELSIVICTHEPESGRLARVLKALAGQSRQDFEILVVDNASKRINVQHEVASALPSARVIAEPELGLSSARKRGFREARADWVVLVDDDNVLAADFVEQLLRITAEHPDLGCFGGRVQAEFEQVPLPWQTEFLPLLALCDHGEAALLSGVVAAPAELHYPQFAPVGAGLVLSRHAARAWLDADAARAPAQRLSDRRGRSSASSGDNDIVLCALAAGLRVGYFPQLNLTHLIPGTRLERAALGRLNRGIQFSWQRVLSLHGINPWSHLSPTGARLRCWRAWLGYQAWRDDAHWVRWMGACGHFEGRVAAVVAQDPA